MFFDWIPIVRQSFRAWWGIHWKRDRIELTGAHGEGHSSVVKELGWHALDWIPFSIPSFNSPHPERKGRKKVRREGVLRFGLWKIRRHVSCRLYMVTFYVLN